MWLARVVEIEYHVVEARLRIHVRRFELRCQPRVRDLQRKRNPISAKFGDSHRSLTHIPIGEGEPGRGFNDGTLRGAVQAKIGIGDIATSKRMMHEDQGELVSEPGSKLSASDSHVAVLTVAHKEGTIHRSNHKAAVLAIVDLHLQCKIA